MRENWITYFIPRGLRRRVRRNSTSYTDCRNIGVIFTNQEESLALKNTLLKFFERDGKYVSFLEFKKGTATRNGAEVCSTGDFNLLGRLNNEYAATFLATPFDYLFCLDKNLSPGLRYFLAHSQAHCRVGLVPEEPSFFDIMFLPAEKNEKNEIGNEIYSYIKKVS